MVPPALKTLPRVLNSRHGGAAEAAFFRGVDIAKCTLVSPSWFINAVEITRKRGAAIWVACTFHSLRLLCQHINKRKIVNGHMPAEP